MIYVYFVSYSLPGKVGCCVVERLSEVKNWEAVNDIMRAMGEQNGSDKPAVITALTLLDIKEGDE
jgi:hypothetical protein